MNEVNMLRTFKRFDSDDDGVVTIEDIISKFDEREAKQKIYKILDEEGIEINFALTFKGFHQILTSSSHESKNMMQICSLQ